MGHAHAHAGAADPPSRHRRVVAGIAAALAVLTVAGLVALWPGDVRDSGEELGLARQVFDADVVDVTTRPCQGTTAADDVPCIRVRFVPTQGPDAGDERSFELPVSPTTPDLAAGDDIVLTYEPRADPGFRYLYADRQRRPVLFGLLAVFVVAVVALGRWRGLSALVGLGMSLVVLLVFILPALLDGRSPVLVAAVGSSAIAFLALYLSHGFRTMTTVALLATLAVLALTVGLAALFTELARFSGFASEEAFVVQLGTDGVDLAGLVLAGMVIGALGALDDVTVTQASAVWELRAADPTMSRWALYRAGLRIGRDHVASTVNTLALAYAGAALPLLILFVLSRQSLGAVANSEIVSIEIVRTLVGSIGLVAAVPLTTWLAVTLAPARRGRRRARVEPPAATA